MVAPVEVERWRSYFGKAGADIWTIIRQAINIAAIDHPKDFRDRRGEIAETLFARSLLMMHVSDVQENFKAEMSRARPSTDIIRADDGDATPAREEGELVESDTRTWQMSKRASMVVTASDDHVIDAVQVRYHEQAEALSNELEKEALLIRDLDGIKATIMEGDQPESVILKLLQELQHMQITVAALKATEIGKDVNCLRKHSSKRVRAVVKDLVRQWKDLVDEWVNSARDAAEAVATEAAGTDYGDGAELCDYEDGLALPPLDEAALLEARAPSLDMSQLLSFMDGEICTGNKDSDKSSVSVKPSVKDNLKCLSRSLSGSMLTDSSDFDTKLSTNHPWGHRTPEERGSATRDMYPPSGKFEKNETILKGQMIQKVPKGLNNKSGLPVLKGTTNGSGPGRPGDEAYKGKLAPGGKPTSGCNGVNRSHFIQKSTTACASNGDKPPNMKLDKTQADQKLEIAKRKLHQGYQQAENAKKQRTVQVLSFPDLPKGAQVVKGKANHSRAGFQGGHGNQNRRFV